ncbi:citramalate synthase [Brachybacterium muris]|uniref:citramalate synthase n=1 Tax=Brachybacterium muris TaxID=219301 RepID=UPI0021F09B3B|nr:citramalate synthase [Brachybacterium muris]MCT1654894.1 citramalate synthase [Brachybacterium muris]MCT2178752.1 citramalate synthase [Brachybacterium muris]MCT2262727.1 citramalate synthase [Brachybacterium muris]MCT2296736.1 citramalate synthase [Brachybacterium muris]
MTTPGPRTAVDPIDAFHLYDTTLRDGSQQEGLTLSVADKLAVARHLDELGVTYIEGGWPGAVPRDTEFFARARTELDLRCARLAAFGATRKAGVPVQEDPQVAALVDSEAPTVTLVAKSDLRHVTGALRTDGEENLAMVRDTVAHLVRLGREVFVDAEHFFDGFAHDPDYTTSVVVEAFAAGARVVVLCDTNGGMLPHQVTEVVEELRARLEAAGHAGARLGAHTHNDSGCAVANALMAVRSGITHVQGCVNGYGERTGNADLLTMLGDLQLKMGLDLVPGETLAEATRIAHAIGEIVNMPVGARAPYVGASAFAHKAGLHASAIRVDPDLYQHMDPRAIGNDMRMIISDMAGRASIELKGRELGFDLTGEQNVLSRLAGTVKQREAEGYSYEAADASFELLLLDEIGRVPRYFEVESWRATSQQLRDGTLETEATVKLRGTVSGTGTGQNGGASTGRAVAIAEGNGPVNALDLALRQALRDRFPLIDQLELQDFKVRILDAHHGTDATTRVLVRTAGADLEFTTVGVGPNIIEASWEAISDAYTYGLYKAGVAAPTG